MVAKGVVAEGVVAKGVVAKGVVAEGVVAKHRKWQLRECRWRVCRDKRVVAYGREVGGSERRLQHEDSGDIYEEGDV